MQASVELQKIYSDALYQVTQLPFPLTLRVGEHSPQAQKLLSAFAGKGAVFITAWNPFGHLQTKSENRHAQELLVAEMQQTGLTLLQGSGSSPTEDWQEDSVLAFPVSREEALGWCHHYRQNAVVFVDAAGWVSLLY